MVWSDTTNKTGIVEDCDFWAGTNSTTYPLVDKARNANKALRQIGRRIIRSMYAESFLDDNNTNFNIEYTDLVSGEDNVTLEAGMFTIERVRVKDSNGEYVTLDQVSRRELTDSELNETGTPTKFYRSGQTIVFAPTPNYGATSGVEVEYQKSLEQEFTATGNDSRVPGFHEDYHPLVSLHMARDYTAINDQERYAVALQEIARIEAQMDQDFQHRNRTEPIELTLKKTQNHHVIV